MDYLRSDLRFIRPLNANSSVGEINTRFGMTYMWRLRAIVKRRKLLFDSIAFENSVQFKSDLA